jgi:hypothetical protein
MRERTEHGGFPPVLIVHMGREAGTPAVVNCAGVYEALVDGERVRLDGALGLVETEVPMGHHARTEVVK